MMLAAGTEIYFAKLRIALHYLPRLESTEKKLGLPLKLDRALVTFIFYFNLVRSFLLN